MAPAGRPPDWQLRREGSRHVLSIGGDWIGQSGLIPAFPADGLAAGATLGFETEQLGKWDSGLVAFLWDAKRAATASGVTVDGATLPDSARKLLALLPEARPKPPLLVPRRFQPFTWVGGRVIGMLAEIGVVSFLFGQAVSGSVRSLVGKARMRPVDLLANIRDAGPSALVIVSVVNFLIGAILAFVGAVQLRKFAADVFVANLVGVAMVREMAGVMTAIVMSGRTGGAYAARIATMRGNEEIDALEVVGIPVSDYLILPSVLALMLTMPLLYLYGCLVGILGGLVVALAMLDVTPLGYFHQTLGAVPFSQFVFGFVKTISFALMIGVTSCRIGLLAGRSAADVGVAATRAVVVGIVGVIAMDAAFAVIATAIGI